MRVAALSMVGLDLTDLDSYRESLCALIAGSASRVLVLPAYSSLALGFGTGNLRAASTFNETRVAVLSAGAGWNEKFLILHAAIAREMSVYLAAGTVFESEGGHYYHTAFCFDPSGEVCCRQRQTHLTFDERAGGLSRGEEVATFALDDFKAALMCGNDCRHPEVGRILSLEGTDILLCSGALQGGYNCWMQVAGVWAQVQQNQTWAVEAQLGIRVAGCDFGAGSAVIGPCEITPGQSGYLARGYPHTPLVTAELDEEARRRLKRKYPLLELLNPAAYRELTGRG